MTAQDPNNTPDPAAPEPYVHYARGRIIGRIAAGAAVGGLLFLGGAAAGLVVFGGAMSMATFTPIALGIYLGAGALGVAGFTWGFRQTEGLGRAEYPEGKPDHLKSGREKAREKESEARGYNKDPEDTPVDLEEKKKKTVNRVKWGLTGLAVLAFGLVSVPTVIAVVAAWAGGAKALVDMYEEHKERKAYQETHPASPATPTVQAKSQVHTPTPSATVAHDESPDREESAEAIRGKFTSRVPDGGIQARLDRVKGDNTTQRS